MATPNQKDWDGLDLFRRMASGVDEREKNSPAGISSDI
jgi:hypothetical protein